MSLRVQRLIALALAGWMLFDFPLLTLWSSNATLVFVWWALLIGLLAWVIERGEGSGEGSGDDDAAPRRDVRDGDIKP
jgi:hypothetical protein